MTSPLKSSSQPLLTYRSQPAGHEIESAHLAANSLFYLAVLCLLVAIPVLLFLGISVALAASHAPSHLIPLLPPTLLAALGITYAVCSKKIRRGNPAAALVAFILAALLQGLTLLLLFFGIILIVTFTPVGIMLTITALLFTLGLTDLLLNLYRFLRWKRRL